MSAGPGSALGEPRAGSVQITGSAVIVGTARLGEGSILAEGAVIRSEDMGVEVGTGSAVLENSVIVGNHMILTIIGRRSVFGHRCTVVGAVVGDLCEIGNASILMPGARLGDRVLLGEGTLVPTGTTLPSDVVAVGRPAAAMSARHPSGSSSVDSPPARPPPCACPETAKAGSSQPSRSRSAKTSTMTDEAPSSERSLFPPTFLPSSSTLSSPSPSGPR